MGFKDSSKVPEPVEMQEQSQQEAVEVTEERRVVRQEAPERQKTMKAEKSVEYVREQESKDKGKRPEKKKSKVPLWALAVGGVVIIAVIAVGVLKSAGLIGGDKRTYFDVADVVYRTELGEFNIRLDVRTYPRGGAPGMNVEEAPPSVEDVLNPGEEEDTGATQTNKWTADNAEWGNTEGTETTDWQYPKYQMTLSGGVQSVEPYKGTLNVAVATEYFNDNFTDITVYDGKMYVNIEQMRYWLVSSKDSHLIEIGNKLPEGSKYLVFDETDQHWYSGYAELDEMADSRVETFRVFWQRLTQMILAVKSTIVGGVSSDAYYTDSDMQFINIKGADADRVMTNFRSIIYALPNINNSFANGGLFSEAGAEQQLKESDNLVNAFDSLLEWLSINDNSVVNFMAEGSARNYMSISNLEVYESSLNMQFSLEDKDYQVAVTASRTLKLPEITLPTGTTCERASLSSPDLVYDVLTDCLNYFNPTSIKLENRLAYDTSRLTDEMYEWVIDRANSTQDTGVFLTRSNVDAYLEKYSAMTEPETPSDELNLAIVDDFFKTVYGFNAAELEDDRSYKEEEEVEVEMYPEIEYEGDGLYVKTMYDIQNSDSTLTHMNVLIANTGDVAVDLALSDFMISDLIGSQTPANNQVLLMNRDNNWDSSKSPETFHLEPHSWEYVDLWFATTTAYQGHVDLLYKGNPIGIVRAY